MITKNSLKKLSAARILNMTEVYRRANGIVPINFQNKMIRGATVIAESEQVSISRTICDIVREVVAQSEITPEMVISALLSDMQYIEDQEKLLAKLATRGIPPMGYAFGSGGMIALYKEGDRYQARQSDHDGKAKFLSDRELIKQLEIESTEKTGRGQRFLDEINRGD